MEVNPRKADKHLLIVPPNIEEAYLASAFLTMDLTTNKKRQLL